MTKIQRDDDMDSNDKLPKINEVVFTEQEAKQNEEYVKLIQQNFLNQHQEIIAKADDSLTTMVRQEKQLYANMAIRYAVQAMAAIMKSRGI